MPSQKNLKTTMKSNESKTEKANDNEKIVSLKIREGFAGVLVSIENQLFLRAGGRRIVVLIVN